MTAMSRHDLSSGTVTFLFTDIEGSTRLLHELGRFDVGQHRCLLALSVSAPRGGVVFGAVIGAPPAGTIDVAGAAPRAAAVSGPATGREGVERLDLGAVATGLALQYLSR